MTGSKNHLLSDEELMEAYKMGHFDAFDILYDRYSGKIRGYLLSKTSSNELADDLLQHIFLKLHNKRLNYDKSFVFIGWIFTIAKNTLTDHFRKTANENTKIQNYTQEQEIQQTIQTDNDNNEELAIHLLKHYKTIGLSEKQVHVLKLKFESDLDYDEIAIQIKTSPANVRQIISRSIRKIKSNFKNLKELSK